MNDTDKLIAAIDAATAAIDRAVAALTPPPPPTPPTDADYEAIMTARLRTPMWTSVERRRGGK